MAVGIMIRLIDLTKLFGLIFILTFGGPGSSTETVAFTTYLVGFKDFIATWNEFLFAIVLTGIETKTMMVLVTSFTTGGTDMFYGEASASVVLGVLPAFAVAFVLRRYFVKGLALGGTKG
jgi:ABC-type glycerol-3-phosphate transport system permease component